MTAFQEIFNALTASGIAPDEAASMLAAVIAEGVAKLEKRPSSASVRQKRYRENLKSRGVTKMQRVTPTHNESVTNRNDVTHPPQTPPKESKILDSTKVVFLDPAAQGFTPSAERKIITEFDLVLSDGTTVIDHEEFEALNKEFGITNSRDLAGMAKRRFLQKIKDGRAFVSAFRTFLTNKAKRPKAAKPTKTQQQDVKDTLYLEQLERDRRYAARNALNGRRPNGP